MTLQGSGLRRLHEGGVDHFVFCLSENAKGLEEKIEQFLRDSIPQCKRVYVTSKEEVVCFSGEYNSKTSIGDCVLDNKSLLACSGDFLVVSWRNIPEASSFQSLQDNKFIERLAVNFVFENDNPFADRSVVYNSSSCLLQETDGESISSESKFASQSNLCFFRKEVFSWLDPSFPFVRPTSLLSILHHVNQQKPGSVAIKVLPFSSLTRQVCLHSEAISSFQTIYPESHLALIVDGESQRLVESTNGLFSVPGVIGSVFRYLYCL